jgi:glycerophosphoryl diester phosphodiesterase
MNWILEIRTDVLTSVFSFFSYLGYSSFLVFFLSLWYWNVQRIEMVRLGILLLLSAILNAYLKDFFQDPRPSAIPHLDSRVEGSFGFPSGHAQIAIVVWFYLAYALQRTWAWTVAALVVIMISLSRLYLGVHDIGDVIGGLAIGTASLLTFLFIEKKGLLSFQNLEHFTSLATLSLFLSIICMEAFFFFTYPIKVPHHVLGYGTLLLGFLYGSILSKPHSTPWKKHRFRHFILHNLLGIAFIILIRKGFSYVWEIWSVEKGFLYPVLQGFSLGFAITATPWILSIALKSQPRNHKPNH